MNHDNPQQAFEEAITAGRLSANEDDANYAGNYMFMGQSTATQAGETVGKVTLFKNINTREYLK